MSVSIFIFHLIVLFGIFIFGAWTIRNHWSKRPMLEDCKDLDCND